MQQVFETVVQHLTDELREAGYVASRARHRVALRRDGAARHSSRVRSIIGILLNLLEEVTTGALANLLLAARIHHDLLVVLEATGVRLLCLLQALAERWPLVNDWIALRLHILISNGTILGFGRARLVLDERLAVLQEFRWVALEINHHLLGL